MNITTATDARRRTRRAPTKAISAAIDIAILQGSGSKYALLAAVLPRQAADPGLAPGLRAWLAR